MGKGFRRGTPSGAKALLGGGGELCPGALTVWGGQSQSFGALFPRKECLGSGEERSEGPPALGSLCCHLPWSPGRRSGDSALHFLGSQESPDFFTHSLASPLVCNILRMGTSTTLPILPSVICEEGSGKVSVYQVSSRGVLAA